MKQFIIPIIFLFAALGVAFYNATSTTQTISLSWLAGFFPGDLVKQGHATVGLLLAVAVFSGIRGVLRSGDAVE